eukprot:357211-Chlamydomonas_euryale.AAC.3
MSMWPGAHPVRVHFVASFGCLLMRGAPVLARFNGQAAGRRGDADAQSIPAMTRRATVRPDPLDF